MHLLLHSEEPTGNNVAFCHASTTGGTDTRTAPVSTASLRGCGRIFAATRVALNYENLAWAAIFAVLTVLAFVVTFRDQGTRGVFAVYDHEEDAVYKSASGTIIALVTAMFFDATGDAFTPHFVIPGGG